MQISVIQRVTLGVIHVHVRTCRPQRHQQNYQGAQCLKLTEINLLLCRECFMNDTLFSSASLWRPWRKDRFTSFNQIPSGSLEEACWIYIWKGTIWIRCCCLFTEPLYCICILHFMKRYTFWHFDKLTGLNFKSSSLNW